MYKRQSEETLPDLFARHLPPEWRWETGGLVSEKRVVELEAGTDFDVLEKAREVHGVCYRWDVPKRLLQVIKPCLLYTSRDTADAGERRNWREGQCWLQSSENDINIA